MTFGIRKCNYTMSLQNKNYTYYSSFLVFFAMMEALCDVSTAVILNAPSPNWNFEAWESVYTFLQFQSASTGFHRQHMYSFLVSASCSEPLVFYSPERVTVSNVLLLSYQRFWTIFLHGWDMKNILWYPPLHLLNPRSVNTNLTNFLKFALKQSKATNSFIGRFCF